MLERSFVLDGWFTPVMVALERLIAADQAVGMPHLPGRERIQPVAAAGRAELVGSGVLGLAEGQCSHGANLPRARPHATPDSPRTDTPC